MERRLNKKAEGYVSEFKEAVREKMTQLGLTITNEGRQLLQFIYDYERLGFAKEDFMKRKRVKSVVPIYDRCCAKRASGEQCTRRKKEGESYCGTHIKGTPHSVMEENVSEPSTPKNVKVDIWAQDIKGIIYYIDKVGNVYDTEDIMKIDKYPKRVIAKYVQDGKGGYSIPSIFGGGSSAV
jgi:hypothetical protein